MPPSKNSPPKPEVKIAPYPSRIDDALYVGDFSATLARAVIEENRHAIYASFSRAVVKGSIPALKELAQRAYGAPTPPESFDDRVQKMSDKELNDEVNQRRAAMQLPPMAPPPTAEPESARDHGEGTEPPPDPPENA